MLDPTSLYTIGERPADLVDPVLVVVLTGFVDAGAATKIAADHLLETLEHRLVARFDVDQLHDYRARRPLMTFQVNRWAGVTPPRLELHRVVDAAGVPFLLLVGPEPDVQWERFSTAVLQLVREFGVRLTVTLASIPMTVPHTRPTGLTAHATRAELVTQTQPWAGTFTVPASAGDLLELRLGEAGHDAMGFAVHVPHYVAQSDYPDAAAVLLEHVDLATGLVLPSGELREAGVRTRAQIDSQVSESAEVASVVAALERQYDAYAGASPRPDLLAGAGESLPSADEIAAAFERFLAQREGDDQP